MCSDIELILHDPTLPFDSATVKVFDVQSSHRVDVGQSMTSV